MGLIDGKLIDYNGKRLPEELDTLNEQLAQITINVKSLGVKGDYNKTTKIGTDDTVTLNQILFNYKGYEIYIPKGVYLISADLVIYSNTTLRLHPEAEIFVKDGTSTGGNPNAYLGKHMLKNHNADGGKNIKIIGGTWNGNGINQTHDSMRGFWLQGIVDLTIEKVKIVEINGWGISMNNITKFLVRDIEFDQLEGQAENGDGVHVTSCKDGLIENIHGFNSDDMVILDAGDILFDYKSDVTNVIIRNLRPKKKGSFDTYKAVALYSTGGYKIDNVIIDGIIGDTYAPMVCIANPRAQEGIGYFGKITLSNIIGNAVSDRQPFNIEKYNDTGGDNSKKVIIDSLIITNYQRKKLSSAINNEPIISMKHTDIKNLTISNFDDEYDGVGGQLFKSNHSTIGNLSLNGYVRKQKTTGLDSDSVFFMQNTNINVFNISNINDSVLSNGSPIAEIDITCLIDNFKVTGINRKIVTGSPTPGAALLFLHATSEIRDVEINNTNIVFEDNSNAVLVYQYGKIHQLFVNNSKCYSKTLPNPISLYNKNSSDNTIVTLLKFSNVYSGTYFSGYANITVTVGKVRAIGLDVVADTSKITDPKNGDLVTNKDGGLSKYNGTAWVAL